MKIIIITLTFLTVYSCGHTDEKSNTLPANEDPMTLFNKGVELVANPKRTNDSLLKAIKLFDKAAQMQPDVKYKANENKFLCQVELGLLSDAVQTQTELEKMKPNDPQMKMQAGALLEIKGDSIKAKEKYMVAEELFKTILDTLKNKQNMEVLNNRSINLKFLGQQKESDEVFKQALSATSSETIKEMITGFNQMTKKELINTLYPALTKSPNR
jgi:tetratricopeptide (TPR) repeat protein